MCTISQSSRLKKWVRPVRGVAPTGLSAWVGQWKWDNPNCVRAFEYYKWWGTLTDKDAKECSTSMKTFNHESLDVSKLTIAFNANDTTRDGMFRYSVHIDGKPHPILPELRARANNSIKMNPTGNWTHFWDNEGNLVMEQHCIVRRQSIEHRVVRVLKDRNHLHCNEYIVDAKTQVILLTAIHAYRRV